MKNKTLFLILAAPLLCGCEQTVSQHEHVDNDKNHICDLCNEKYSDHIDENGDNKCDICEQEIESPIEYALWPEKEIQDEVIVVSGSLVKIPEYNKATKIEINTDTEIDDGYFSIYCYTEDENSEIEYLEALLNAGWEVSESKDEAGFYDAYDSNYEININFGYFDDYKDLEICVAFCYKTKWPEKEIADYLQLLVPGTKTVIPKFEAYTTIVNYYETPSLHAIAINAIGYEDSIIEDYKNILTENQWSVSYNDTSTEWNAFSSDEDVELHFYIDSNQFNVDLFHYEAPVPNWPYDQIQEAIDFWNATGTILPFRKDDVTFQFDWSAAYPGVFIYCDDSKKEEYRDEYNQMLLDNGYIYVGDFVGEPLYAYPGTTLAYRATILMGYLQIETMILEEPAK